MRSPVTSRSNCAKESRTFSVSRPSDEVVLNCWVTETKLTPRASNPSKILAKSARLRVRRVHYLIDNDRVDLLASMSASRHWSAGRSMEPPEYPPSS